MRSVCLLLLCCVIQPFGMRHLWSPISYRFLVLLPLLLLLLLMVLYSLFSTTTGPKTKSLCSTGRGVWRGHYLVQQLMVGWTSLRVCTRATRACPATTSSSCPPASSCQGHPVRSGAVHTMDSFRCIGLVMIIWGLARLWRAYDADFLNVKSVTGRACVKLWNFGYIYLSFHVFRYLWGNFGEIEVSWEQV